METPSVLFTVAAAAALLAWLIWRSFQRVRANSGGNLLVSPRAAAENSRSPFHCSSVQHPSRGRVILITGCDSGLGQSLALHLSTGGASVLAGCLTEKGMNELIAQGASRTGGSIRPFLLDVTSDRSIQGALTQVKQHAPNGIDVLLNNAGTMAGSHLVEFTSLDTYQRTMDVNFFGVVRMCKAFLPQLKQRAATGKSGLRIINVSSFLGRVSPFSMSAYSSSKYALEAFSDSLRQELRGFSISVSLVEPGAMKTDMAKGMKEDGRRRWEAGEEGLRAEYGVEYPRAMARSGLMLDLISRDVSQMMSPLDHAVHAVHPKHRYICGLDAWAFAVVSSFLPSWLNDFACLTVLGHPRAAALKKGSKQQINPKLE